MKNSLLSIVIPVFNEEQVIRESYQRVTKFLESVEQTFELIFINDGSKDETWSIIKELSVKDQRIGAISFSRNFGHGPAISAGLLYSRGDAVVILDADLQDPPEVIGEFIKKWEEGFHVVYGIRTKRKEGLLKRSAYKTFYRVFRKIANLQDSPLDAGDFSLIDRKVVDVLNNLPEKNRFLRGLRSWSGFRQIGVPYERAGRYAGKTKYSLNKLFALAGDGIFSFSYVPLRLVTFFGFFIASLSVLAIIILFSLRLYYGIIGVPGYTSTTIIVMFMGSIQLISIGILGEYIGRIYDEAKGRPAYVIQEVAGKPFPDPVK